MAKIVFKKKKISKHPETVQKECSLCQQCNSSSFGMLRNAYSETKQVRTFRVRVMFQQKNKQTKKKRSETCVQGCFWTEPLILVMALSYPHQPTTLQAGPEHGT